MKKEKTIKAYKAFNPDFTCRGFQYKVGEEYTHDGEVNACQSGFHACQNPFDVLDYYPLVTENGEITRFAEVEQSGTIDVDNNKTCSSNIKVNAELNLAGFIKAGIEWIKELTNPDNIKNEVSGNSAKIGSSGNDSVICCTGHNSIVKAKKGSWITLSEWVFSDDKQRYIPKCVKTEYVDCKRIKGDTWYKLINGEFVKQNI